MRHTKKRWLPNIQSIRIVDHGQVRKANVCTRCIRGNKVAKATA
jgi:large subunit ribosomal protein L28